MTRKFSETIPFYFILSLVIIVCALLLRSIFIPLFPPLSELESAVNERRRIVLDPGHGGKDGGALSVTGADEKHLNLDISL